MTTRPSVRTDNFDMDTFFDFSQGTTQPSPITAGGSRNDAMSPFDKQDERRQFSGPSHDYNQYKQQVGLPVGSMVNMPPQSMFDGYSSGIGDMGFESMNGWSSGIDMDADMGVDFANPNSAMPAMFFPPVANDGAHDNFVNPNTIGTHDEPSSNVGRLWPGMHSQQAQQAAMQKAAQVQAMQQRQVKLQTQQAHYRQPSVQSQNAAAPQQSNGSSKRPSHVTEPHVEESISRLLSQMRQKSASDEAGSPDDLLPQIARMKKDEEEMDEDERLLASDEGKKLSSKERRQLRNKVSARAFRSRRKEYIGQLEGEVAMKAQEAHTLRNENQALMQENERYRGLIETLLRHPAFTPFINDISKDPSVLGSATMLQSQLQPTPPQPQQPQQQQQQQQAPVAPAANSQSSEASQGQQQQQVDMKPEFLNFDASQIQVPGQSSQEQQIGVALVPDNDFSKLNINGLHRVADFNGFQSVNAFAMTGVSVGPDPIDLLATQPVATSSQPELNLLLARLDGAARHLNSRT